MKLFEKLLELSPSVARSADRPHLLLVGALCIGVGAGPYLTVGPIAPTIEFSGPPGDTFRSDPQAVEMHEMGGSVLATTDSFRLLTDVTEARLSTCQSTRPDLPDESFDPAEVEDRVGTLSLAVFDKEKVNFSFRSTEGTPEYVLTVEAEEDDDLELSSEESGRLVVSATDARLNVTRDKVLTFYCPGAADFTIILSP